MSLRAVSFDLDDTLWPIRPVIERAEQRLHQWLSRCCPRVAEQFSVQELRSLRERLAQDHPQLAHDFSTLRRMTLREAMQSQGHGEPEVEQAYRVFFASRNEVEFFDDALPTLDRLVSRFTLLSISNGNADVEQVGLGAYFRVSVQARDVGQPKPHPAIFHRATQAIGLEPAQVVHVGDCLESDVVGALDAGLRAVWLNRHREDIEPPEGAGVIESLVQLPDLLASWTRAPDPS